MSTPTNQIVGSVPEASATLNPLRPGRSATVDIEMVHVAGPQGRVASRSSSPVS